jgi:hypothetical protein
VALDQAAAAQSLARSADRPGGLVDPLALCLFCGLASAQKTLACDPHNRRQTPLLIPALGGSLPDYVFTKILGIPAFVVPYANADEANHAPNKNLELDRFIMGIKTGAAMLTHLGELQG